MPGREDGEKLLDELLLRMADGGPLRALLRAAQAAACSGVSGGERNADPEPVEEKDASGCD